MKRTISTMSSRVIRAFLLSATCFSLWLVATYFIQEDLLSDEKEIIKIVNVAGRQRMFSQKLSKTVLLVLHKDEESSINDLRRTLEANRNAWHNSMLALKDGSQEFDIVSIKPFVKEDTWQRMMTHHQQLYTIVGQAVDGNPVEMTELLNAESNYLYYMNALVDEVEASGQKASEKRENILLGLLGLLFALIVASFFLFIRPIITDLLTQNAKLADADEFSRNFAVKLEEQVQSRTEELYESRKRLQETTKDVMDSIFYAKRLQQGVLPSLSSIKESTNDCFIFFKPRDIVSGDFYWFRKTENGYIIICADCTGHGVPGAIMSMMGIQLFNKCVIDKGVTNPAEMLKSVDEGVRNLFNNYDNGLVTDGMDVGVCVVNTKAKEIQFAGAANRALLMSNDEHQTLKGMRYGLGGIVKPTIDSCEVITKTYSEGDMLYLFSDGYLDQFGGPNNKKVLIKNFRKLLLNIHTLDCEKQYKELDNHFKNWKGSEPQVDDVLVMGVRL